MTAKEYLSQAHRLDMRIQNLNDEIESMNALATKVTSTVSDMPRSASRNVHRTEDIIVNIMEFQDELEEAMNKLVNLKRDIWNTISKLDNDEYRVLLEKRYLSSERWEEIAVEMGYSIDHIFRMHREALDLIKVPKHNSK